MEAMANLEAIRKGFITLGNIYPAHPSVKVQQATIAGIQCYWFVPEPVSPTGRAQGDRVQDSHEQDNWVRGDRVILYLHGGAFGLGSIESHSAMVTHFAAALQTRILFIEYALAPEHPYPTAIEEVVSVYSELVGNAGDKQAFRSIGFIGDSAGGGLTVSTISALQQRNLPQPNSVVLLSPWLDLTCSNPSYEERRQQDRILTREGLLAFAKNYAGYNTPLAQNADSDSVPISSPRSLSDVNPNAMPIASPRSLYDVSPKNAPLKSFPPVLVLVGTNEVLLDDSRHFYEAVRSMQSNAHLSIYEEQYHVWPLSDIHSDASRDALKEISVFHESVK